MLLHNLLSHKHQVEMEHEFTLKKKLFAFSFQKSTAHAVFIRSNNLHLEDRISRQQKPFSLSSKSRVKTSSKIQGYLRERRKSSRYLPSVQLCSKWNFPQLYFVYGLSDFPFLLTWAGLHEAPFLRGHAIENKHIYNIMYHFICFVLV